MSGLRENLGEWARGHGDQVAASVADHEASARGAIAKRRRNRVLATTATAAATLVGVVALASALPGVNDAPPADRLPRHLSELVCGDPWVVEPGTTDFVSQPDYYFEAPQGDWVLTDDNGDTHTGYSGFTAGLGSVSWQGDIEVRHRVIVRARVVAVKGGEIVGVTEDQYARPGDGGVAALYANAPHPGPCGDTTAGASSGKVTYHLVMQVQSVEDDAKTIATIVDPGGPKTVAIDGVEAYLEELAGPSAQREEPQGDRYQAFLVRAPIEASCTPLQDVHALGTPTANDNAYYVNLPGVQRLTNGMWAGDPVIVSDASLHGAWYAGLGAWLVADEQGDMSEPSLGWSNDERTLTEVQGAPRPPSSLDCPELYRLDAVKGAVYLVIDGVDWPRVMARYPLLDLATTEGWQTWIYLGQADDTTDPDYTIGLP